MANPTTVEGLLAAVQNHGQNHRGSLSAPVMPKTSGGAHLDFGPGPHPLPRYDRNRSISGDQYSVYGAFPHPKPVPWLNKLCHEPEGDIETCCLGFWLPCALYGNTQYRLKQMAQGDDPLDLKEHKHNNGPCWMHQMLCFFFRCEWCVVMLQHSRIRATYNIDGTAGGDCVQSYYCPCCTLMQDEREVVAREQRIVRQQSGTGEVTEQPGFEPQMRYSTRNLLEEIPEICRDLNQGSYPSSTQGLIAPSHGSVRDNRRQSFEGCSNHHERDGRHGHEMDDLSSFSLGHSDADASDMEHGHRQSRSCRSSQSSGKLRVRETSPLGSVLNPITVSRSVSVDHGIANNKQHTDVPQRSVTSPTRRRSLKDTNPPAAKSTNYRLKSIITDEYPEFLIETIREGSESSNPAMTVTSRTAVKSFAMDSLRSVASKQGTSKLDSVDHKERSQKMPTSVRETDLPNDEAYTTFYNNQGKLVTRRISECLHPRASSPEPPEIYALHHANPNDDDNTVELKKHLSQEASKEVKKQADQKEMLLKLKLQPAAAISQTQSLKSPTVIVGDGLLPVATPTITQAVLRDASWLGNPTGIISTPSSQYHTISEHSLPSDFLSLPAGVNDADDVASYLDQAVKDSGSKLKTQKLLDSSAMPHGPGTGILPPRKQTFGLHFNSEDSGSDSEPTPRQVSETFTLPLFKGYNTESSSKVVTPKAVINQRVSRGVQPVDRYPSYIATLDGAGLSPVEMEAGTSLELQYDGGRHMNDVTKEFGELTPRHKKSVSDWFKDIGRTNSNKSDRDFNVKVHADEVPPVPVLPQHLRDQGFTLGPLRSFSPLGFKGIVGREKSKGKSAFSTMGPSQKLSDKAIGTRTVSMPPMPPVPMEFVNAPLADATNNAEIILETQDKLQVLQEEFKLMAEEVAYEINSQSPSPTPAVRGGTWGSDYLGPASLSTIAITTGSKQEGAKTPTKLGQRSFSLVNSASNTPMSSLSDASATTFLVSSGAVDVDHSHSRHGADIGNANAYDKATLMSTITELSSTPIYGKDSTTTFAQSLGTVDLPSNLETPSAIPQGFLEHMRSEFPITPSPETPVELEEVVVEQISPVKYFNRPVLEIPERTVSLDAVSTTSTTGSNGSTPSEGCNSSGGNGKSGHVHEDQEVEVANSFNPASAAAAMNTTTNARVVSSTLHAPKETDPFSHPFFSGTAVLDFALINPRKMRQQLASSGSDEMGSEETIRPAAEVNPLLTDGLVAPTEENPLHTVDTDMPSKESKEEVEIEVLTGDDVTTLDPPPDHPITTERMDDALAAITTKPRASSMHGALTRPIIESDELRRVCDGLNRGDLVYETSHEEEIVEVGAHGPVIPKAKRMRKNGARKGKNGEGLGGSGTVVRRSVSMAAETTGISTVPGNARLHAAIKDEVGGTPKVVMAEAVDKLVVTDTTPPVMPAASPRRVRSPAEVMLRGLMDKVTGKTVTPGKEVMSGGLVGERGGASGNGSSKKRRSQNSPQRRRERAERKRREKELEKAEGGVGK